jgi:hypothetical protein
MPPSDDGGSKFGQYPIAPLLAGVVKLYIPLRNDTVAVSGSVITRSSHIS